MLKVPAAMRRCGSDHRVPGQHAVARIVRSRLRTAVHHPGMQLLHRAAGGREKKEGQEGVDQGRKTGSEQRDGEAQSNVHMLQIALADRLRMLREKLLQGHGLCSRKNESKPYAWIERSSTAFLQPSCAPCHATIIRASIPSRPWITIQTWDRPPIEPWPGQRPAMAWSSSQRSRRLGALVLAIVDQVVDHGGIGEGRGVAE